MVHRAFLVFFAVLISLSAHAWGGKGHAMATEAATGALPASLPAFFHRSYPMLISFSDEPDEWRNAGPSANSAEFPDHYIDLEFVAGMRFPNRRYDFVDELVRSGVLRQHGVSAQDIGFIPWRIAEMSELLEQQWRIWRRSELSPGERAQKEATIVHLAAALAHFAADVSNPLHTSMHHNGWMADTNPQGFATDCDFHGRFETYFVTANVTLDDVVRHVAEPKPARDYFARAVDAVKSSNALIEELYRLDRDGEVRGNGTARGREYTAERIASGASLIRDLWWSTWVNSAEPARRR